jgi:hypothetical protein
MREPEIRDADLLAELEASRGKIGFEFKVHHLENRQRERDRLAAMSRDARRRAIIQRELEDNKAAREDMRHIHSVLAICGLPYKRLPPDVREFERKQGNMALDVSAGFLRDTNGIKRPQPVPFGPKARLILMHLCSEAIRQKSATIDIAETFTGFVRDLGFPDSGGKKGPLTAFKEQLNALSACTMRMSVWTGERVRTRTITPIEEIDLWLAANPSQRSLWPSTVTFSPAMYESLKRHALPVNVKAVRAFAGSARKLDLYFWLGYRLHNIAKETMRATRATARSSRTSIRRLRISRMSFRSSLFGSTNMASGYRLPTSNCWRFQRRVKSRLWHRRLGGVREEVTADLVALFRRLAGALYRTEHCRTFFSEHLPEFQNRAA